ncbi:hypothetical protein BWQ96_02799 [Gracilariopsis chorda]|uniref:Protein kinase domain-containing protein n=1 Tax=Gracilariopsis chorda TaxID=448386 RepID=A0A2V3IZ92_9FLOR|nr:hypothetical protein BWQ96_02799 [Gracilariopsis chorda]|eukprot:PXF47468.1 hypothetical protein BWQ96_02799 [Gracilariopsis chorda]
MVIGPFGVDAAAVTDVIAIVRDVADRVRAPRRILHDLTYIIDRESHTEVTDANQSGRFAANREYSVHSLLNEYPFLSDSHRELNGDNSALTWRTFVRLAARRDFFTDVVKTAERYQNNHMQEKILHLQREILDNFVELRDSFHINPCHNWLGAKTLKDCPSTYLRALKHEDQDHYAPIHRFVNDCRVVPIWSPAPKSPHLFHHPYGKKRLEVLLEVAKALETAHSCRWYHGRLTPSMILRLKPSSSKNMHRHHLEPVVVLNFFDEKNGCRSCERCSQIPLENPTTFSFRHNYTPTISGGSLTRAQDDVLIFANLLCWIYASELYDFTESHDWRSNREILQHVPWPLHFLVVDGLHLPMSTIHLWLSHLYKDHLEPHSFDQPFISLNPHTSGTITSTFPAGVPSESAAIHSCALRAVLRASSQDASEAIVHLGNYWREKAQAGIGLSRENGVNPHNYAMTNAYNCYLAATNLGSEEGLLCVARLQTAALYQIPILPSIHPPPTSSRILSIILHAALRGNQRAFYYLSRISKEGLHVIIDDTNPSITLPKRASQQEPVGELELLEVIWRIGRIFRTGGLGILRCEHTALGWLGFAAARGFPPASFDLGMHLVQTATNLREAVQGLEKLKLLCNNIPHESAFRACFRVGRWLYYGLPHEFPTYAQTNIEDSTNIQDRARSLSYIRKASDGGIPDAKVLYAVILRKGVAGVLDPDIPASDKLLSKVKDCPPAHYADAIQRITVAREAYDKQTRQHSFALSTGESIGSSSNGRKSSQNTSSTEDRPSGRKEKGRVFSMLGGGRRQRPENQGGDRGMQGVNEGNFKPKTNGKTKPAARGATDHFKRDVEDGFREPNGDMTRKGIARCFEVCENILTSGPPNFDKNWPGERLNPYPYYTAARLMIKHCASWAECASSEHSAAEQQAILGRARKHLIAATSVVTVQGADGQNMWEKLRTDWRQEDLSVIRKAKSELEQLRRRGF